MGVGYKAPVGNSELQTLVLLTKGLDGLVSVTGSWPSGRVSWVLGLAFFLPLLVIDLKMLET